MDKQEDLILKNGVTKITDEQGNLLLQVELTPNMITVLGVDKTPLLRSWRDILILKWRHAPLNQITEVPGGYFTTDIAEYDSDGKPII